MLVRPLAFPYSLDFHSSQLSLEVFVSVDAKSCKSGLVLSVLDAARKRCLPMPAGGIMWSPWVDLSDSFSGTWTLNQATDYLPRDIAHSIALGYAGPEVVSHHQTFCI